MLLVQDIVLQSIMHHTCCGFSFPDTSLLKVSSVAVSVRSGSSTASSDKDPAPLVRSSVHLFDPILNTMTPCKCGVCHNAKELLPDLPRLPQPWQKCHILYHALYLHRGGFGKHGALHAKSIATNTMNILEGLEQSSEGWIQGEKNKNSGRTGRCHGESAPSRPTCMWEG